MSSVQGNRHYYWHTNTTDAAHSGSLDVNAVVLTAGATGGQTTLTEDGDNWIDVIVPANGTLVFTFATPQLTKNLTLAALGTNVLVFVYFD